MINKTLIDLGQPHLTLVDEEEDSVGGHRAIGEEHRVVLDVGAAEVEQPGRRTL